MLFVALVENLINFLIVIGIVLTLMRETKMKTELSFKLTASNPHPDYTQYTFDDEVITLSSSPDDGGWWIWSSKLGCSQLYDTPEQAIMETCRRHGVVVLKLDQI